MGVNLKVGDCVLLVRDHLFTVVGIGPNTIPSPEGGDISLLRVNSTLLGAKGPNTKLQLVMLVEARIRECAITVWRRGILHENVQRGRGI